jgi:hypothetical protein
MKNDVKRKMVLHFGERHALKSPSAEIPVGISLAQIVKRGQHETQRIKMCVPNEGRSCERDSTSSACERDEASAISIF